MVIKKLKRRIYSVEDSSVFLVDNQGINKDIKNDFFSRSPKNIKTNIL